MLVVVSDLHLQDTVNDAITDGNNKILVNADRNVSPEAFRMIFQELISVAESNKAKELIIVLAGDIFDLNRSSKWFAKDIRPYGEDDPGQWGPIAVTILNDIIESNKETFNIITTLSKERKVYPADPEKPPITLSKNIKFQFKYIPGNHDRLVSLHSPLIEIVRGLLGLNDANKGEFDHELCEEDYGVHIRHGHEYDSSCFAGKIPKKGTLTVKKEDYKLANLGDYMTIDFAARLAHVYRRRYEKEIISGPDAKTHRLIYRKLLEFDDLRPQSKMMSFLEAEINDKKIWEYLSPVFSEIIEAALNNKFLRKQIGGWKILAAKAAKCLLSPNKLISLLVYFIASSKGPEPWQFARREQALDFTEYRYVVSGHTHNPDVEFLSNQREGHKEKETFFFDTGTWRQQIRKCRDEQTFAKAKALTYVVFYRRDEDPLKGHSRMKGYSYDYWSGFTKKETV